MALIIEDGSRVAGSDSYVSAVDAQAFVDARGYTVTITEASLLNSMLHLESMRWFGLPTDVEQSLQWPRTGVRDRNNYLYASNAIPDEIKNAQVWLAYYILIGDDPSVKAGPQVKSEKVGPIETEYAINTGRDGVSVLSLPNVKKSIQWLVQPSGSLHRA